MCGWDQFHPEGEGEWGENGERMGRHGKQRNDWLAVDSLSLRLDYWGDFCICQWIFLVLNLLGFWVFCGEKPCTKVYIITIFAQENFIKRHA